MTAVAAQPETIDLADVVAAMEAHVAEIPPGPSDEEIAAEHVEVEVDLRPGDLDTLNGEAEVTIRCPLTEEVYCQQHEYGDRRLTRIDDETNLVTEVVDAGPDFSRPGRADARLRIRAWTDKKIKLNFVSSPGLLRNGDHTGEDVVNTYHATMLRSISHAVDEEVNTWSYADRKAWHSLSDTDNRVNYKTSIWFEGNDTTTSATTTSYSPWRNYTTADTTNSTTVFYDAYRDALGRHVKYWSGRGEDQTVIDPKQRMRDILRHRRAPRVHIRHGNSPGPAKTQAEVRARQTLRRMIGEEAYRKYLSRGFVLVFGCSGRIYQVQPGHKFTKVWYEGEQIEQLCAVLPSEFAPTDSVIMRICLIEQSEDLFKGKAIKHGADRRRPNDISYAPYNQRIAVPGVEDIAEESLPAIFAKLKEQEKKIVAAA